ncbi:MAG TPA: hypothetical protein VHQ65_06260 [Thermoanaerobaculia bacterium]|nr:hypothetical protein [Thermoanaerobaculia bacterium]
MSLGAAGPGLAAAALGRGGWVVLERGGGLWGVAGEDVRGVGSGAGGLTVRLAGGELAADRVLAVVPELAVHPVPEALTRFWPEAAAGLAVHGDRPLVVVDPRRPPRVLAPQDEGPHLAPGRESAAAES